MSAAEALRAQAQHARTRLAPRERAPREPAPLPDKVRQTVDLTGEQHQGFNGWKLETALALGRPRPLSTQEALAAVIAVLLDDDSVSRRVRAHLEDR